MLNHSSTAVVTWHSKDCNSFGYLPLKGEIMFEFYFYLLRNGDPEHQLKFDHWTTPEEVVTRLRRYITGRDSFGDGVFET
jgi:hypothetical protein